MREDRRGRCRQCRASGRHSKPGTMDGTRSRRAAAMDGQSPWQRGKAWLHARCRTAQGRTDNKMHVVDVRDAARKSRKDGDAAGVVDWASAHTTKALTALFADKAHNGGLDTGPKLVDGVASEPWRRTYSTRSFYITTASMFLSSWRCGARR